MQSGAESVFYARSAGRIYSIAFSESGLLHFVNANDNTIHKVIKILGFIFTVPVHTHNTYVRAIAFDDGGNLYFSEASGAGADGKIFRIDSGSPAPTLYQEIRLSDVGGFWAGDFTFGARGNLYVSTGNRIPSSIYRLRDGVWEEVFKDDSAPIKGLASLACELLCYANWGSEMYMLDVRSGSRDLEYSNPIHLWTSDVALFNPQITEMTMYEGKRVYTCNSTAWRDDGSVSDTGIFFDIDANNADIATLLADIGAPTTPTTDDEEIWNRTRIVWVWLKANGLGPGDSNYEEAQHYQSTLGHWPTIAEYAHMFVTWGGFFWAGCTCSCRAVAFATLLYRVGIPVDRMAIAETRWKLAHSQHMYIVLRLGCHWYYVDPTMGIPELAKTPENVGSGPADYVHPNSLLLIPGSTIGKPMLVR
jgi:hypothetical protein